MDNNLERTELARPLECVPKIKQTNFQQATDFITDACDALKLDITNMQSKTRAGGVPLARMGIMYTIRRYWIYFGLKETGALVRPQAPLSHSAVHHGVNKFTDLLSIKDKQAVKINIVLSNLIQEKYADRR